MMIDDDVIEQTIARAFPDRAIAAVEPQSSRAENRTVRLRFQDGKQAFLKIAVDGCAGRIARDAAVTRYADRHSRVLVPTWLCAHTTGELPFVATAPIGGMPASDRWPDASTDERAEILRRVGGGLGDLHAVRFEESGRIVGGGADGLDLVRGSWPEVLRVTIERRWATLSSERFENLFDRTLSLLRERRERLNSAPAALLHDDIRPENTFLASDGIGLIDWETAIVGDPSLDVCRAESQCVDRKDVDHGDREALREELWTGYRDRAGELPDGFEDRRPIYRAVTFLRTVRTFDLWAPADDVPEDESAAWVREAMERSIDRA